MRNLFGLAVVAVIVFVSGCSAQESTDVSPPAEAETRAASEAERCDAAVAHPKGAFEFAPKLNDSLPAEWREEFAVVLANLKEVAPISSCLHDFTDYETGKNSVKSPLSIYAWSNTVSNPWP